MIKLKFFNLTFTLPVFSFLKLLKKFNCFTSFKITKIVFLLKKVTKIVQQRHVNFALDPRPRFFQGRELANTGYGPLNHFKNINYFTLFRNTFR